MEETLSTEGVESGGSETNDTMFSAGWDQESSPVDLDAAETVDTTTQQQPDAKPAETEAKPDETPQAQSEATQTQRSAAPTEFRVKYMDEEKTVSMDEAVPLIQKGMDYDRIRTKYDEAKPAIEVISLYAKQMNMSIAEYVAKLRVEEKVNAGMSEEDARRSVELDSRELELRQKEEAKAQETQQETKRQEAEGKTRADIAEFVKQNPDVKPADIPQEVWDKVQGGMSLTSAYLQHQNAQLRLQLEAAKTNAAGAARSTGSMKSAGEDGGGKDPFQQGWED